MKTAIAQLLFAANFAIFGITAPGYAMDGGDPQMRYGRIDENAAANELDLAQTLSDLAQRAPNAVAEAVSNEEIIGVLQTLALLANHNLMQKYIIHDENAGRDFNGWEMCFVFSTCGFYDMFSQPSYERNRRAQWITNSLDFFPTTANQLGAIDLLRHMQPVIATDRNDYILAYKELVQRYVDCHARFRGRFPGHCAYVNYELNQSLKLGILLQKGLLNDAVMKVLFDTAPDHHGAVAASFDTWLNDFYMQQRAANPELPAAHLLSRVGKAIELRIIAALARSYGEEFKTAAIRARLRAGFTQVRRDGGAEL